MMTSRTEGGRNRTQWVILLCYTTLLAAVSLMPVSRDSALAATAPRRMVNNLLHVPAYVVLAWLWAARIRCRVRCASDLWWILVGSAGAALFGTMMEYAQLYVPGRKGTAADTMLNVIGACAFALSMWLWRRRTAGRILHPDHGGPIRNSRAGG